MSDQSSPRDFHAASSPEHPEATMPSRADANRAIAHDIRSPLNAVLGLCDLLAQSEPLTGRQKEFIKTLKASAGALAEQVNRLLENNGQKAQRVMPSPLNAPETELPHAPPPSEPDHKPRVLLVDDYAPNALVVATYLEKFGYDYDVADNGVEAVTLARRNRYIACLMDVQMHDMDGIEATMAIRDFERQEHRPHLPIIGITAHALSGDRERCIDAGMDEYVAKPFNPSELETRLAAFNH
ncbi:MAG: response regulator [Asticcacaulis sp.]|uniref:response regulator n=1 Tax=Asticcacaulis sp. TaxID=1872648 RepID=UPI0039E4B0A7